MGEQVNKGYTLSRTKMQNTYFGRHVAKKALL